MAEISIIFTLSVILFASPFFSKYLRIPTAPIEIILGMICAYLGFISDFYLFELTAHVGFFYLMFMAGSEVNLKMFTKINKVVLPKAIIYLMSLYILSALSVAYLELNAILVIIVPTLSVGLILALYKDYAKNTSWLNFSMLVGTLGELVSIALLTFTGAAFEFGVGIELYKSVAYLFILLGAIIVLFRLLHVLFWWYPELKIYLMPHANKEEQDLRLSMALFSLMIAIMLWLHLEIAFGAFIAGIFIATFFEHKEELPHKISSFGFGFLVPIFFVYIGSTFDLELLLNANVITQALTIVILMIAVRLLSALVFLKTMHIWDISKFALSQSMPLTLLIAIATIAFSSSQIALDLYSALIFAALLQVIIAMLGIKTIITFEEKYKKN